MKLTFGQALEKAIQAHRDGELQKADRLYTAILKAQPKHPDANHNMGVLAVSVGKIEQSLPFFKLALDSNSSIAQFWLSYIDALIQLGRVFDAKAVLDEARGKGAKGDSFDKIEEKLASLGNSSTVTSFTTKAKDPPQHQLQPLINLYSEGKLQQTLDKVFQLLQQFPNSVVLYNIQGAANKGLGQLDAALKSYNWALSINANNADAHYNLGIALRDQGKLQEAVEAYKKALLIKPDNADGYYNMGMTLKEQGKLEDAIEAYKKALLIKPDYAQASNNIGVVLKEQGKLEEAKEAFGNALSIKPNYAEAYINRGAVSQEQGKLEEAKEAFYQALTINPDYVQAYYNIGITLKEQGKLEEAIEAYIEALSRNPFYAAAHNNMGVILKEQGRLEEAIEAFYKALSIKPDYAEAFNNKGITLIAQGKLEDGIEAYSKALSINPSYAEAIENFLKLETQLLGTSLTDSGFFSQTDKKFTPQILDRPNFQIQNAIKAYLLFDFNQTRLQIKKFISFNQIMLEKLNPKDRKFCDAYSIFLGRLLNETFDNFLISGSEKKVYHLGESHCLSYAHRHIMVSGSIFKITPMITYGGKAFHFSQRKNDSFKAITKVNFNSVPKGSNVFISFGEIDCRLNEGFLPAAIKLNKPVKKLISETVVGYLTWFAEQNKSQNHSLFFFNVPAPVYSKEYTVKENAEVANVVKLFNAKIAKHIVQYGFKLIKVFQFTVGKGGFSNGCYHVDDKHLGSKAVLEIEKQLT